MLRLKQLVQNQSGQAMVEFALVLPVLLLLLFGIMEFGWTFSNQLAIDNASREGARYGMIYSSDADQINKIENQALSTLPDYLKGSVTVTAQYSVPGLPKTGDIVVEANYAAPPLTPLAGVFLGDEVKLSSKCVMKVQ